MKMKDAALGLFLAVTLAASSSPTSHAADDDPISAISKGISCVNKGDLHGFLAVVHPRWHQEIKRSYREQDKSMLACKIMSCRFREYKGEVKEVAIIRCAISSSAWTASRPDFLDNVLIFDQWLTKENGKWIQDGSKHLKQINYRFGGSGLLIEKASETILSEIKSWGLEPNRTLVGILLGNLV